MAWTRRSTRATMERLPVLTAALSLALAASPGWAHASTEEIAETLTLVHARPLDRRLLELRFLRGYSLKEVAALPRLGRWVSMILLQFLPPRGLLWIASNR